MRRIHPLCLVLAGAIACSHSPSARTPGPRASVEAAVGAMLDEWHAAAARADESAYFSHFAEDAVFMGTDRSERWDVASFRAYAHPHFAGGHAWSFRATRRAVSVSPSGEYAWFDEDLDTPNLGPARGSGVVVRVGNEYKLLQYDLSVPIPNERFRDVKRLLETAAGPPHLENDSQPSATFTDPERARKLEALFPKLADVVKAAFQELKIPSLAVAFVTTDRAAPWTLVLGVRDVGSRAPAGSDTIYRVGSITKTFTAEALLALRDAGRLGLDDRLDRYLPEAGNLRYEPGDSRPITLRQILTHTSGLPRLGDFDYTLPTRDVPESEMLGALARAEVHAPGTAYLYSNFAVALLGPVIARASGKSYRAFLHDALFAPLGMRSSGFDPAELPADRLATGYGAKHSETPEPAWRLGASEAAGGLYASLDDMTKWVSFQLDAWPPRDDPDQGALARASRREAHTVGRHIGFHASAEENKVEGATSGIGYAWHIDEDCSYAMMVHHDGAVDGFHATVSFAPDRGFGLVALANAVDADTDLVERRILDLVAKSDALRPRQAVPSKKLTALIDRFAETFADVDEKTYSSLFSDRFRSQIPLAKMREAHATFLKRHGACRAPAVDDVQSPTSAVFRLACERGTLVVTANAQGDQFAGILLRSSGFSPSKELDQAVQHVLALGRTWDAAAIDKSFTPKWQSERDSLKKVLSDMTSKGGLCKVDGPGDGNGEGRAKYSLACSKGPRYELGMALAEDGKIAELLIRPKITGKCRQ